ncbi:serine/threonine-protein kinase AtPK2/AtPK19 isoform X2 [Physcomitrium patens]|uniref:serine/threonine-protein kinase AtPK2/AtPK19 isoform X2 n=1 Tax=Physcomitrium patens TaxID=3218 RepID=UPI000D16CEFE|nr:serine/threonine-protein kinase AtPK2/AtPK19-like isoform X2 [Physcomitrium patens]|eukprot:XP_024391162.1 serine/threonine-protein kinase AtPK2/AtPK19-like isoform X2 [Physcomitrella patens]
MAATNRINLPPNQQFSPLLLPEKHAADATQECDEEFDFSDVFGPAPPHPIPQLPPVAENEDATEWCSELRQDPVVVYSRSHSLVGPSPKPSLSRVQGKPLLDEADCSSPASGAASAPSTVKGVNELACQVTGLVLSDSGDSESEREGDDQVQKDPDSGNGVEKLGPQDFELLRVVGQGAFGKVFQVQKIGTSEIYAMKVMRKQNILKKNQGSYMKAERDILTKVVHPYIVQLRYSFQTRSKLYLVLDFINGGHLFFQLYRQGTFSEDLARMYTAEIVLALAHLHKNGIIHRDLKPENILLDAEGHVMLTDFGLAKEVKEDSPSKSLCGTMEYMAPEIVQHKGHGKAADWWSVGILLYEMLTGEPPFANNNRQKLQEKIVKDKIKLPTYLTSDANNLLKGVNISYRRTRISDLEVDPTEVMTSNSTSGSNLSTGVSLKCVK